MCFSKPKAPKVQQIAMAPTASPSPIDDVAMTERDRTRKRLRSRYGRTSTILAGETGAAPTMPVKTALGA